jgi:hypothetical protein
MIVSQVSRLMDRTPRQWYHYARRKLLRQGRLQTFSEEHPCIFVLSTGRTGTQTLAALFSLATNVVSYHEPTPKLYELSWWSYRYIGEAGAHQILEAAFRAIRHEITSYALDCNLGYVETSPQATFLAPVISEVITNAKFIHLVRNPRDVVRSGMRRNWYSGHPADKTRIVPNPGSQWEQRWSTYNSFQKNLWLWAETNRWILKFCSSLPANRVLLAHSEDIFTGRERALMQLYTFINAPMPAKWKITRVLRKVLNAQKSGTFPEATSWSEEMNADLHEITGKVAGDLGYELC